MGGELTSQWDLHVRKQSARDPATRLLADPPVSSYLTREEWDALPGRRKAHALSQCRGTLLQYPAPNLTGSKSARSVTVSLPFPRLAGMANVAQSSLGGAIDFMPARKPECFAVQLLDQNYAFRQPIYAKCQSKNE